MSHCLPLSHEATLWHRDTPLLPSRRIRWAPSNHPMSYFNDPDAAMRARLEAGSKERLNEVGPRPSEGSTVDSIIQSSLKGKGPHLRDQEARINYKPDQARLTDPNDPYTLLHLNRANQIEPEIDPHIPLIRPIFKRFLRDLVVGILGIGLLSLALLVFGSISFCIYFGFLLSCTYIFFLGLFTFFLGP